MEEWDYAHCLPYFKKAENRLQGADEYHGSNGPLYLDTAACDNPLFTAFFKEVRFAGVSWTGVTVKTDLGKNILNSLGYKATSINLSVPIVYKALEMGDAEAGLAYVKQHPEIYRGWLDGVTTAAGEPALPAFEAYLAKQ